VILVFNKILGGKNFKKIFGISYKILESQGEK